MADEALTFDASGSGLSGEDVGTPLSVGPGTSYALTEHAYPAADLAVQFASSVDTEGELPVSRHHGNRTISIKLEMVDAGGSLLAALQAKFAKLQREGGTLKRTMKNGDIRIYDLLAAGGWDPVYDLKYYLGDLTEVTLTLPAQPFSRGVEITLSDHVETSLPAVVFTETSIPGDVDALARLVIDEDQSQAQRTIMWGLRSRRYTNSGFAALLMDAESQTHINTVAAAGPAGASGSGNNTAYDATLPAAFGTGDDEQFQIFSRHVGNFRVYARVQVPATNTGTVSVALKYRNANDAYTTLDTVTISPSYEGMWVLIDLGLVNFRVPFYGAVADNEMVPLALSTVAGDDIYWDCFFFIPADEGSGVAFNTGTTVLIGAGTHLQFSSQGSMWVSTIPALPALPNWSKTIYEGDYIRIPPTGSESRTVEIIVKGSRGKVINTPGLAFSASYADAGIDDISARLYITPRYLA